MSSRLFFVAVLVVAITACGGTRYPERWEPTATWIPHGRKGDAAMPALSEPDHDRDGVDNALDRCPDLPEDRDGYRDEDGCPDPDNDGDGVPDRKEPPGP